MSPHRISDIEKLISRKLHALRRKDERVRLLYGICATALTAAAVFGVAGLLEGFFRFSSPLRTILAGAVIAVPAIAAVFFVIRPLLSITGIAARRSDFDLAAAAGHRIPQIKDRLLNLLQLAEDRKKGAGYYSADLIDASYGDLAETIERSDLTAAVTWEKPLQTGRSALYGVVMIVLLFLISPSHFGAAVYRLAHYDREFAVPRAFTLMIEPGDVEAVRGDSVTVRVTVEGEAQSQVSLFTRQEEQVAFEEIVLRRTAGGDFVYPFAQLRRTVEYYAARGGESTPRHTITVTDRPSVRDLQVTVSYPAYTGLPSRELDAAAGAISALYGSRASVTLAAGKELDEAEIVFADGEPVPMEIDGRNARARFTIDRDDRFHFRLTDTDGIGNADPVEYTVRVVADEHPNVSILEPGRDLNIDESLRLPMLFRIQDDYGFTRLRLGYRLLESRYEAAHEEYTYIDIPLPAGVATDEIVDYLWDVRPLRLAPEDVVSYHAAVYDNDAVSGPKRGQSDSYVFRLPSLDEVFAEMDSRQTRSRDELEYSVEEAEQLRRDLDDIRQELQLAQHEMNWERQQRMREMLDRYEQLQEHLEAMERDLDEMIDEMQRHNVLSAETLEKYMELQELYSQITDPEFKRAMERLREAMDRMDPAELREAMRNMTFNEEQFRQSLERTLNLLKRVQIEQKVDELMKRAEEMVREQQAVEEALAESPDAETAEQIDRQMTDLAAQLDRMMEELADLQRRMEEFPTEMPLEDLQQVMDGMTESQLQETIEQMQQQMQQGDMQQAQQSHAGIQQELGSMQQNIAQMQQSLLEDQMRRIVDEMRRAMRNINALSMRQEDLRDDTRSLEANSQLFRDNARRQNEVVTDLGSVVDDLIALSQKTFAITPDMGRAIGSAFRQMQEALNRLDARNGTQASRNQEGAMASLNEASLLLQQSLEAMMQGGEGGGMGGFMQQLQNMAAQQQQLNIDTQGLADGSMSMEQRAQMERLAREQEAVRRSLEEMQLEMQGTGARERILGDLERIERDMREVVTQLQADELQPETIQRQERILSRLLDAQRSIRERDYEERREGRTADQFVRESPMDIDLETQEGRDRMREHLLHAVREGYSRDYERLIRRYFELLQALESAEE
jgi:hypothetical protein